MEIGKIDKKIIKTQTPKKETTYEFDVNITNKSNKEIMNLINIGKFRILEETIKV